MKKVRNLLLTAALAVVNSVTFAQTDTIPVEPPYVPPSTDNSGGGSSSGSGDCIGTIPGCGCRTNGFSTTTGQSCIGNVSTSLPNNVTNVPATNITVTVEDVRAALWMFQSKPAFLSWAVRRCADEGNIGLDFQSPIMIASGGYGWYRQYNSPSPSIDEMSNLVSSNEVLFPIAREGQVTVTVTYRDKNWVTLFEGKSVKYAYQDYSHPQPVDDEIRWSLYGSDPVVTIAKNIRIVLKGVRYLQIFPEGGGEPMWLYADRNGGFDIPRSVIGSRAVIVAVDNSGNGKHITFDLGTGQVRRSGNVHGRIRPTMEGTLILTNAASIVIRPEAQYGRYGSDILAEANYTHHMRQVRIVARTSEGETARGVYIVNVETGDYDEYQINWNEDILLDFRRGRYHVIPAWWNFRDSTFQEPTDTHPSRQ